MKKCPYCQMIVDADYECPFCYTTITYEPPVYSDKEKYIFNKHFILYLIKQSWFSVLCLIVVVLRMCFIKTFTIYPIVFLGISLIYSFFGRKITKLMQWEYSAGYAEIRTVGVKVLTGVLAVLFSFMLR